MQQVTEQLYQTRCELDSVVRSKSDVEHRLLARDELSASTTDELTRLSERVSVLYQEKNHLSEQINELNKVHLPLQFEKARMEQEKETLHRQCVWMETEIQQKNQEFVKYRAEKVSFYFFLSFFLSFLVNY